MWVIIWIMVRLSGGLMLKERWIFIYHTLKKLTPNSRRKFITFIIPKLPLPSRCLIANFPETNQR